MNMELSVDNEPRAVPSVESFVVTTLSQLPLPKEESARIGQIVVAAAKDAIENAYLPGESGSVKLTINDAVGKLEIAVRDFGLPQNVTALDDNLKDTKSVAEWLHASHAAEIVDQIHWLAFGPQGKALQLVRWLHTDNVADTSPAELLVSVAPTVPLAPEQQYAVRRMLPNEAMQVSQLMYRTYGTTYFNQDVYYPDRIAAQNEHGSLISVVAVGEDGQVAGHCALELDQPGPVAEIGQAAVNPAHRGRGLLDKMKDALEQEARALKLVGMYADAVTVHTFTQQSNAHHGGHVCGVDLAVSPKSEAFRGIAGELQQRVSCVLYIHWLEQPQSRTVFVPPQHHDMVAAIYENIQAPVEFGEAAPTPQEHGTFTVKFDSSAAMATIRVEQLGGDSVAAIRRSVRDLVERSRAEVVVVELPLGEPATADVCTALEADGVAFTGIGSHFSPTGDVLRLAYLVEPLARDPIKTFEPFAARVVEYALAEQERVRANL